jgi:Zn-finger nucleic acid-binding protein
MECPVCKVTLLMAEKQGIEIDYCPTCRGVWLDRGELEKIIERTVSSENRPDQFSNEERRNYGGSHEFDHDDNHGSKYGRKRNFFSELFD